MSLRLTALALAFAIVLSSVALTGCAAPIATLEERLETSTATRPYPRDLFASAIPYRLNLVYAHAMLEQIEDPEFAESTLPDSGNYPTGALAVFDFFASGRGPALFGLLTAPSSRDPDQARRENIRLQGLRLTAVPSTHYYFIDSAQGEAFPEHVDFAWDQAYRVFNAVHNRDGRCYANFWTPERLYSPVRVINARGVKKKVDFRCPHSLRPDLPDQLVTVVAFANPFDGYRVVSAVQARCWSHELPSGLEFIDYRDCGDRLAAIQRPYLPETDLPLLELVTTPIPEDPTRFHVVGRFNGRETVLPAPPGLGDEYHEWLATQPYSVE